MLQLTDRDRDLLYDEFPYLDAPLLEGEPDIGIHIGLDKQTSVESPIDLDLFYDYRDTREWIASIMLKPEFIWWTVKTLLNINLEPFQVVILEEMWNKPFPILVASRGASKSFLLSIYIILRCVLNPGCQIAVIGFGLRQSRNLYEYVEKLWRNAPILREMVSGDKRSGPKHEQIRSTFVFGESICMFLPLGHSGATIRGVRAQYIIIDEYGDVPKIIVDTVVAGFGAVSGDPIEKRNLLAKIRRLKASGDWDNNKEQEMAKILQCNQMILSGTAKFHFNHFAQDWIRHKTIIQARTKENLMKLWDVKDRDKVPEPSLYSVIRIPYELIPEGIMQKQMILNIQGSSSKAVFEQEYQAVFSDDSDGFFKAKLLHMCTANDVIERGGLKIADPFDPIFRGDPKRKYILGFDPAAEVDNAAIVILELHDNHARVVYCWTINKKVYEKEIMQVEGLPYHKYLAKKIALLHKTFNFTVLSFDAQGGGKAVAEILEREQDARPLGMPPLLPVVEGHVLWDGKEKPSDDIEGEHIIELVEFGSAKWNTEAHYGLRTDLEQRRLIFPRFDALSIDIDEDEISFIDESTAEISSEIEQLKYELTILEHTVTPGGNRERWDTPEVKQDNDKKGRLRNDRASALIVANMAARRIRLAYPEIDYFSEFTSTPKKKDGPWKSAPLWFKQSKGSSSIGVFKMIGD